jgi:drug/metabolite transporter (DMT)-like permease
MGEAMGKAGSEKAMTHGKPASMKNASDELVSRQTQAGIGLFTGLLVYCAAFGGLFALGFAVAHQRMDEQLSPRATAAALAVLGFSTLCIVPLLKYPANPPAVGLPDTIAIRTELYLVLILSSLIVAIIAGMLRNRLRPTWGAWNATLLALAGYCVVIISIAHLLPNINEVPEHFPAPVLWQFRIASIGGQALLWATLGVGFGIAAERLIEEGE